MRTTVIYDPGANSWTQPGGSLLNSARARHSLTAYADGKILAAGGYDWNEFATAELFDPATNTWTYTADMATARHDHAGILLSNGKVLVAGGRNTDGTIAAAELYDRDTNTWSPAGSLSVARQALTFSLLPDGRVLAVGGLDNSSNATSAVDIYDPAGNSWSAGPSLSVARTGHAVVTLANGKIAAIGGMDSAGAALSSVEIYDPVANTWSASASLTTARLYPGATLLQSGKILIVGGSSSSTSSYALATAEILDSEGSPSWNFIQESLASRTSHASSTLGNGKILFSGGFLGNIPLKTCILFDPATGTLTQTGDLNTGRALHQAVVLADGRVLAVGGVTHPTNNSILTSAELYDPATGTWTNTGSVALARAKSVAVLMSTGKVLLTGGQTDRQNSIQTRATEVYDPATGLWSAAPDMQDPRVGHDAIELSNGKILVAGGYCGPSNCANPANVSYSIDSELFDPVTETWSLGPSLSTAHYGIKLIGLQNGKILIAGGYGVVQSELYDPVANAWSITGSVSNQRMNYTLGLYPDGKALLLGGYTGSGLPTTLILPVEIYDPDLGTWSQLGSLSPGRFHHSQNLLPDGRVLVFGGDGGSKESSAYNVRSILEYTFYTRYAPIALTASGGTAPYTFSLQSGTGVLQSDGTFTPTAAGTSVIQVEDALGATATATINAN